MQKDTNKEIILNDNVINKNARMLALQSNLSLIPMTIGGAASTGLFVLEMYSYLYFSLGLLIFGGATLISNITFRQAHFKETFMQAHNKAIQKENKNKLKKIKKSLNNAKAVKQIELFQSKHDRFENVLNDQLTESSLAHQRLLGAFDQLNSIALTNIEKVLNYQENMGKIDQPYILGELKKLEKLEIKRALESHELSEKETLTERLNLRKDYSSKIGMILADNEKALTKMDLTLASLTELKKPENMRSVLNELQMLANVLDNRSS